RRSRRSEINEEEEQILREATKHLTRPSRSPQIGGRSPLLQGNAAASRFLGGAGSLRRSPDAQMRARRRDLPEVESNPQSRGSVRGHRAAQRAAGGPVV